VELDSGIKESLGDCWEACFCADEVFGLGDRVEGLDC
jgi:hypothetical protein